MVALLDIFHKIMLKVLMITEIRKQLIAIYRTHFKVSKEAALSQIDKALSWVNLSSEEILKKIQFSTFWWST